MRYYVTRESGEKLGYPWNLSLYKINMQMHAEVIRFYSNGNITKDIIQPVNPYFINNFCEEISQEEYEQMLGL